jgi:hypothetical protein
MDGKLCEKWDTSHKDRSPITNRKIKHDGPTYKQLEKKCRKYKGVGVHDIVLGDQVLVKKSAIGDGNCFYHSLARLYLDDYRGTRHEGTSLRRLVAESLTLKKYVEIGNGLLAKLDLVEASGINTTQHEFDSMNALQISRNRRDPNLYRILKDNFSKFHRAFMTTHVYANEYMLEYTARYLRINIIVVGNNGTITSPRRLVKRYTSVFVYNYFENHYEPLVGIDGETMFSWRDVKNMVGDVSFLGLS